MQEQMDLFESSFEKPNLPSKVRLIEFFAGIGAQAKALEILGKDYENWRTVEWSWNSIIAYNAIHHKDFSDKSKDKTYEEVIKAISGISHDYNKPMTEKEIRHRGEGWARKVYSSMVTNKNVKPNICDVHAADLGITERELYIHYDLLISVPRFEQRRKDGRNGKEQRNQKRTALGGWAHS